VITRQEGLTEIGSKARGAAEGLGGGGGGGSLGWGGGGVGGGGVLRRSLRRGDARKIQLAVQNKNRSKGLC